MKKDILQLLLLLFIGASASSIFYKYNYVFTAGTIAGIFTTLLLLVSLGKYQARQVAKSIEKRMRDHVLNRD